MELQCSVGAQPQLAFFFRISNFRTARKPNSEKLVAALQTQNGRRQTFCFPLLVANPAVPQIACAIHQIMSSNPKQKAECPTIAGPTCGREGCIEAWKQFWPKAKTKTKKRRKKPLTREESRRRKQMKHEKKTRDNVIKRMKQNKPVVHLLQDPSVAQLLTESDFRMH